MKKIFKLIDSAFKIGQSAVEHRVGPYAAQASFFIILSLVPSAMFIISMINRIIPYVLSQSELDIIFRVSAIFPSPLSEWTESVIWDILEKSSGISIVTAITSLWFSSRGFMALAQGISNVLSDGERQNYFIMRFLSIIYMFVFTVLMVFTIALLVFGNRIAAFLSPELPYSVGVITKILHLRWIIVFIILMSFFTLFYKFMPKQKRKIKELIPGAALAAGGWLVFSFAFNVYIKFAKSYASIYGSISYTILAMLWLYLV